MVLSIVIGYSPMFYNNKPKFETCFAGQEAKEYGDIQTECQCLKRELSVNHEIVDQSRRPSLCPRPQRNLLRSA